jgi:hypothetical protein
MRDFLLPLSTIIGVQRRRADIAPFSGLTAFRTSR